MPKNIYWRHIGDFSSPLKTFVTYFDTFVKKMIIVWNKILHLHRKVESTIADVKKRKSRSKGTSYK